MLPLNAPQFTALVFSTAVHAAFLMLVMQSGSQALVEAEAQAQARSKKQLIASLFFLQDPHAVRLDGYALVSAEESPAITLPIPELPQIEAIAADSFEKGDALETADDVAEAERLQGIYVKQINARIARVLQMTLAQIDATTTEQRCIVHIIQNERGDVLDVDTHQCQLEALARERLAASIRA
ncbi:MAG: hypothetical protein ACREV5_06155, partial [Steroidobacter sp.]